MTDINSLFPSNYLKKEDFPGPRALTIRELKREQLDNEDKLVLYFHEEAKGFVLNKINAQLISAELNTPQVEAWTGRQITLYNDPSVSFQGKLTGGIRVQVHPKQAPAAAAPAPATVPATATPAPSGGPDQLKQALNGPVPGVDDVPQHYDERNPPPFNDDIPF